MRPKLVSARFLPKKTGPPQSHKPASLQPWFKTLLASNGAALPAYNPLLHHLDAVGENPRLVAALKTSLSENNTKDSLKQWKLLNNIKMGRSKVSSFKDLSLKYNAHTLPQLEGIINELTQLDIESFKQMWACVSTSQLYIYLLPRVVERKLRWDGREPVRTLIHELASVSTTPTQFQAINFALNAYLHSSKPTYDELVLLLEPLDARIHPHLHEYVSRKIELCNKRADLVTIFELFRDKKVSMAPKGMSSFLRAVFSSSDHGAEMVINEYQNLRYSLGFYYFLVKKLCQRKDKEKVDWIFENILFKIATHDTKHVPFILHMLIVRTIAFDGLQNVIPVLEQMKSGVDEPSWMLMFQEFRRLGRLDKCQDTLSRTLAQGHKLSMSYVSEYLLMVSQNYDLHEFMSALETVIPEITPVLDSLNIRDVLHGVPPATEHYSLLKLGPEVRNFTVTQIHESWLSIAYEAVLNNVDDAATIQDLYHQYRSYALESNTTLSIGIVDQFVLRLLRLRKSYTLDLAEEIFKDALTNLKLKTAKGRYNSTSLTKLNASFPASPAGIQRSLELLQFAHDHNAVSARGQASTKTLGSLTQLDPEKAELFKQWVIKAGGIIADPEHEEPEFSEYPEDPEYSESSLEHISR